MVIFEDVYDDEANVVILEDITPTQEVPLLEWQVEETQISLHALIGISSPETFKLVNYIKHHKVIVLMDSGNTHNFIHHCIAEETLCCIHVVNNF